MSDSITEAVDAAAEKLLSQLSHLTDTEAEAMQPVVDLLLKDRTIPAASSKSNHGAFPGGLIVHTHRVWAILSKLADGASLSTFDFITESIPLVQGPDLVREERLSLSDDSVFKAAVIHDLNKIQDAVGSPHYVPNILKSGKVSDAKPWEVNKESGLLQSLKKSVMAIVDGSTDMDTGPEDWWDDVMVGDGIQVRDGLVSIAVAKSVSPKLKLTPQERNAILYHDGAYSGRQGLQGNESTLQILLHAADMIASRVLC